MAFGMIFGAFSKDVGECQLAIMSARRAPVVLIPTTEIDVGHAYQTHKRACSLTPPWPVAQG